MKQGQQLYIRNERGRYEPFIPKEPDVDNKLYRKINGKYYPFGMELKIDTLQEGVWVVTREKSCAEIANGKYLREQFRLEKCSGLDYVSISKLGGLEKCARHVIDELSLMNTTCMTKSDFVHAVIGKVFEYFNNTKNEKRIEGNRF